MPYEAKVILDSVGPNGARLTTFELSYPRFVHAELMTHRMFCLAADAMLEFEMPAAQDSGRRRVYRMSIQDFVHKWIHGARPHQSRWGTERTYDLKPRLREMRIRQLDEATGEIVTSTVLDACESGSKPVYEVSAGKHTLPGSADHLVFTPSGWKKIGELVLGDEVIVSTALRPDQLKLDPIRLKKIDGRWRSTWQREQRDILKKRDPTCMVCRERPGEEIHHIVPVYQAPDRAFDPENVGLVCDECHLLQHRKQGWQTGNPLYSGTVAVDGVRFRGVEPTYDLSIAGPFANFLANKVVVHNSRNSASSRAIPTGKLIARIRQDPALPVYWGKNESGMQASGELSEEDQVVATEMILSLRDRAILDVAELGSVGLHKQVANRYLEPWMFITVIVTATHFQNFFDLRDHAKAQPELRETAAKAHALYKSSEPKVLHDGEWHMPFVSGRDREQLVQGGFSDADIKWIAVGRCARVSYLTHDGQRDPNADLTLGKVKMRENGHMSPLEHVAEAMTVERWRVYADECAKLWISRGIPVGNLWGWKQLRKTVWGEDEFSRLQESTP